MFVIKQYCTDGTEQMHSYSLFCALLFSQLKSILDLPFWKRINNLELLKLMCYLELFVETFPSFF